MRWASAVGRLLLFALLVLGTAGMHTIGHPPEAEGVTAVQAAQAAQAVQTVGHDAAGGCPDGHCPAPAESPAHHGGGMDPMSLCLAVALAAFVLVVARYAGRRLARGGAAALSVGARAVWARLVSGLPPPRPPELSRLSVLRI